MYVHAFAASARMEMPYCYFSPAVPVLMLRLRRSRNRGDVRGVRRQSYQQLSLETPAAVGQSLGGGRAGAEVEGVDSWKHSRRDSELSAITHMLCTNPPVCTLTHSSSGAEGFQGPFQNELISRSKLAEARRPPPPPRLPPNPGNPSQPGGRARG